MSEMRTKTVYRPPIGKYVGLALIVNPKDKRSNTIYRPLIRREKGLEASQDPEQRKKDNRAALGTFILVALLIALFSYFQSRWL